MRRRWPRFAAIIAVFALVAASMFSGQHRSSAQSPPSSRAVGVLLENYSTTGLHRANGSHAAGPAHVTVTGVLNAIFGDPEPGSGLPPQSRYDLQEANGHTWTLNLPPDAANAAGGPRALNRQTVAASGDAASENVLDVSSLSPAGGASASASPSVLPLSGSQKWATLLCRFSDEAGLSPQPLSFFNDLMSNTKPGIDNFWREVSYGNINLTGSAQYDWQNLPNTRASYYDATNKGVKLRTLAQDCVTAHDASVNFSQFVGINIMTNDTFDGCCAWGGSSGTLTTGDGTFNFSATWMPPPAWGSQASDHGVVGQEMGHGFGLPHEGCFGTTSPYDSYWDVQSRAQGHQVHTNADFKDQLNWIPGGRRYDATTATNQIVNLERLALPGPAGYLMAKIPIGGSATHYYTVEARKFAGYDGSPDQVPAEAVVIHDVDTTRTDKIAQVVTDGVGPCNGSGGAWVPGEKFTDPANNISIAVVSGFSSGFTIAINPPAVPTATPTLTPTTTPTLTPTATPTLTPTSTPTATPTIDPALDTDGDGCPDARELGADWHTGGQRDPNNKWDFFDVPVPALLPGATTGTRNKFITLADVLADLAYVGTKLSAPTTANAAGAMYGSDINANGVPDGQEYDRAASTTPGQLWRSGPPNGFVTLADVLVVLAQVGTNCS